ncbi:ribosome recycling factor family protein [Shewanella woodyi]|uniref:ribosome recycling factor family protein n=1 Tax=Shewanella woodyi TaxID=60961 RepID=UPI003747E98D
MIEKISLSLPSLIHRIGREAVKNAQAIALQSNCELKRVRRSRNWEVIGEAIKLQSFSTELKKQEDGLFGFLIKKIDKGLLSHSEKLEPLETKLARLIAANSNITLAELIHITDCTLAEARAARLNSDAW